ncbi:hypothetical protein KC332_g6966 [Hortaea werneckii]|nr:hypothetical protein KC358_g6637 [Hortaea werneckii]KAI6845129.1 hypothetical protein KC350_g4591 [Hortaea werneckii]KAI6932874.1 hypothetical protein KC341_g8700 [Hortaea werneckii]KAI6933499.1 hypothetical protein KC348_g6712 [Hortaea werneckii]KAI6971814.1 hypothetical protein KC321_g6563 [Hortaea werneckii]
MHDKKMSGPQFQGQPSPGTPFGSIPQRAPQGFQPHQASPSTFDGSESLSGSQPMTQPSSQQQMPPYQHDPYQAPPTGPSPFQGQPSQSYHSGSMPPTPQLQMQDAGSPLPQQQWQNQGYPGQNFVQTPQQHMQSPFHQSGPPSEWTSATSEEDSDNDSSESDDDADNDENDEDEDEDEEGEEGVSPTTVNHHNGWPQQAQTPVMPPQQPRAASLASSLSGASKSTARQSQPVGKTHPKVPPR